MLLTGYDSLQAQTYEWANRMGETNDDRGWFLVVDGVGNVYTTGSFSGTVDFDPVSGTAPLISAGGFDIFVSKLSQTSVGIRPEVAWGVQLYPNPTADFLTIELEQPLPDATLELFHVTGQRMLHFPVQRLQKTALDIRHLEQGVYFLCITLKRKSAFYKVIKN